MPHIIFLSYAHDDNQVPRPEFTGWVDFFDQMLTIELRERALDCKLWRDRRDIDPIAFFDDKILNAVRESKILVAVVSPLYVDRNYCLDELVAFVESHGNGIGPSGAESILKVVKRDLPEERQPEAIRRKTGVAFFRIDQERKEEVPFYEGYGQHQDKEYWGAIRRIGASIEKHLARSPQPTPAPSVEAGTIFLAITSAGLAGKWDDLRNELESNGYRVAPGHHSLPTQDDDATLAIEAGLKDACLSVHLIGETAGFQPDGADEPVVHKQFAAAADRQAGNTRWKRIVWLPKDLRSGDPQHASFIERLRRYDELEDGDEILNGDTFEDLKSVVLSELRRQAKHIDPTPDISSQPRRVYLICTEEDEAAALQVYKILANAGIEVLLPEFTAGEPERQTHHDSQLAGCDGALIYYGEASHAFAQQHIDALADRSPTGRTEPLTVTGVYLAPPVTPRKEVFRSQFLDTVIQGFDGPDEGVLWPFLDRLAKGRES